MFPGELLNDYFCLRQIMLKGMHITGIIPARYGSTRFPGKPLALLGDRTVIRWVYESAAASFDHIAVATDDERIAEEVALFGGNCIMTRDDHPSGTDRCLEAIEYLEKNFSIRSDIVVNVQGDEPMIQNREINQLISCFEDEEAEIATLVHEMGPHDNPSDTGTVKVVVDQKQRALYFSRSVIPFLRDPDHGHPYLRHIGLYGFRRKTLETICNFERSQLEKAESLEQLRWLENGISIHTRKVHHTGHGIDTPEDLEKVKQLLGLQ